MHLIEIKLNMICLIYKKYQIYLLKFSNLMQIQLRHCLKLN